LDLITILGFAGNIGISSAEARRKSGLPCPGAQADQGVAAPAADRHPTI
jgi:hypothetical protein